MDRGDLLLEWPSGLTWYGLLVRPGVLHFHPEARGNPPPPPMNQWQLLKGSVRILLKCILVLCCCLFLIFYVQVNFLCNNVHVSSPVLQAYQSCMSSLFTKVLRPLANRASNFKINSPGQKFTSPDFPLQKNISK